MNPRVLDTNAVLYLLSGRAVDFPERGFYAVSVVTEIELLAYRFAAPEAEAEVEAFLSRVEIEGLTETVKRHAIRIRRETRLKLPDAIVAGTALALGAELVSNDASMTRVAGLRTIRLELQPPDAP